MRVQRLHALGIGGVGGQEGGLRSARAARHHPVPESQRLAGPVTGTGHVVGAQPVGLVFVTA